MMKTLKRQSRSRLVLALLFLSVVLLSAAAGAEAGNRYVNTREGDKARPLVAVENVCAWPNLTVLPDGAIVATIFNQPSHGSVAGDVECWATEDAGRTWQKRGTPAPLLVSYCCLFEVTGREFIRRAQQHYPDEGVVPVMVPCVARLSVADLLGPFELGADGVVIAACREGSCLYPTAEESLLRRVRQAKDILAEIGLERDRIDYWKTEKSAETSWTAFWALSRMKLESMQQTHKGMAT